MLPGPCTSFVILWGLRVIVFSTEQNVYKSMQCACAFGFEEKLLYASIGISASSGLVPQNEELYCCIVYMCA